MKKRTKKSKEIDREREFAVILEQVNSNIKIIIEDLSSLKKRVNAIFEEQGKLREEIFPIKTDIRLIKADIAVLKGDVAEIKEALKSHGQRIASLETLK